MNTLNSLNSGNSYKFQLLAGINLDTIPDNRRLIRVVYRSNSEKARLAGSKKESQGVIVPVISTTLADDPIVRSWIVMHMNKIQDDIARAVYESGRTYLVDSDIDSVAIMTSITTIMSDERAASIRLSGKSIIAWYDKYMATVLSQHLANKLSCTVSDIRVIKVVKAYCDAFMLLAGKSKIEDAKLDNLTKAIEILISNVIDMDTECNVMVDRLLSAIDTNSKMVMPSTDMLSLI